MTARLSKAAALLALLFLLVAASPVLADDLSSLHIDVALQADGSGIVTETRDMTLTKGTEVYIPMNDQAGTELSNFMVQENGVPFSERTPWDVNAGRENKAGHYGINRTKSGYELCWGIGEYGRHTYTVQYRLSGMVRQLEDGQSMYWKLFNEGTNLPPKQLRMTVSGPMPFTAEDTLIWGFGFPGEVHLENGKLVGTATEALTSSHKVILLMQFKQQFFQTTVQNPMTMAEQQTQAKEGSSYGAAAPSGGQSTSGILSSLMSLAVPFLFIGFMFFRRRLTGTGATQGAKGRDSGAYRRNADKYYRDVPYTDGAMTDVAYPLSELAMGGLESYFNAYLLKWLQEGNVRHVPEEQGFFRKKEVSTIHLVHDRMPDTGLESRLWNMMHEAAGADRILQSNEFSRWATQHHERIEDWTEDLDASSRRVMNQGGYTTLVERKVLGIFSTTEVGFSAQGEALKDRLVQYRNFLKDYTLLAERSADHVVLWDQMLIWASLFGIAEEVAKQFEALDPKYFADQGLTFADIYLMNAFSHHFAQSYESAVAADSMSSGGGGGFTSIGGGGGSFGGGFGGGSR